MGGGESIGDDNRDAIEREDVGSVHTWADSSRERKDRIDGWRSAQRGGWNGGGGCFFILPPSPFLPVFSVRTDRMGRAFSPLGLLFRPKPPSNSRLSTLIPLSSRLYTVLSIRWAVSISVDCCFFLGTGSAKQEGKKEKKRILFVCGRVFRAID
jgi:hypothetical protein